MKRQLDTYVTKCVDDHMNLIPTMTKKMKESAPVHGEIEVCCWPLGLRAGIYLKRGMGVLGLSGEVYE